MSIKNALVILFAYRCLMSILGQFFIVKYTRLGDSKTWQAAEFDFGERWIFQSNLITNNISSVFSELFLANDFDPVRSFSFELLLVPIVGATRHFSDGVS